MIRQDSDAPQASGGTGASKLAPGLHVVATPIGNLGDLSPRAREVLAAADLVACEDTRVTGRLLHLVGLRNRLQAYNDHNAPEIRPRLLAMLQDGKAIALVSDAGTPCISDPGYKLVREAVEAGAAVHAVPGASSVLAALAVAGLPTDRFLFAGFLPSRSAARRAALAELAPVRATLVLLEAAPRLAAMLAEAAGVLGEREAVVLRELTKLHEEARRGTLDGLARHYATAGAPKGEIVVVVGPPAARVAEPDPARLDAALREAAARLRPREAAAEVAAATGLPANRLYRRLMELKDDAGRN